jgi:hypothetical protein
MELEAEQIERILEWYNFMDGIITPSEEDNQLLSDLLTELAVINR